MGDPACQRRWKSVLRSTYTITPFSGTLQDSWLWNDHKGKDFWRSLVQIAAQGRVRHEVRLLRGLSCLIFPELNLQMTPLSYTYISRETGTLPENNWFTIYCWPGGNMLKLPAQRSTESSGFKMLLNYYEVSWIIVTAYTHDTMNPN